MSSRVIASRATQSRHRWLITVGSILLALLIIGSAIVAVKRGSGATPQERERQRLLRSFHDMPRPFRSEFMTLVDLSREAKDFETAATVLKVAAEEQPKNAIVFELLGDVYQEGGDVEGAEAAYRRAILDDAAIITPYTKLADLIWYHARGRASEIESILLQGIRATNHLNLHKRLARYYTDIGNKKRALEGWRYILKQEPNNAGVKDEIANLERSG